MPRFSVAFGRRKSAADNLDNTPAEPSFRVLDRTEVLENKNFDGGARLSAKTHHMTTTSVSDINIEDNIFADLKNNRGSGSSNTTKTTYTDNSSRHSNVSTAPSSTVDVGGKIHEEPRSSLRKEYADIPIPPIPKTNSGFLKGSGRSWSFGGQRKHQPASVPVEKQETQSPQRGQPTSPTFSETSQTRQSFTGRARATTTSTATTVTPPKLEEDFNLDLGGDFGRSLLDYNKRASMMSVGENAALAPRSLTGTRANQPTPLKIDQTTSVEPGPFSWGSQHSNDRLVGSPTYPSIHSNLPPPVPQHGSMARGMKIPSPESSINSPMLGPKRHPSPEGDTEGEDSKLLKDSLAAVSRFMSKGAKDSSAPTARYRRNEDTFNSRQAPRESKPQFNAGRFDPGDDENLFGNSAISKSARLVNNRPTSRPKTSPPQTKVMTPAQFEKYRKDKEREDREAADDASDTVKPDDEAGDDQEDNYEDDEDEIEKARQQAKQRRKQEAHMTVYRQQMMKVTGESTTNLGQSRPSFQMSLSTPNLLAPHNIGGPTTSPSDNSEEDEEVPLAILAAHGFPNKNRPPTRLNNMMSNPNLRAAAQPSYQRPGSVVGTAAGAGGTLPAFARNLPQDPFVGASLVNGPPRESFALGGGSPTPTPGAVPPGGLIGVIANEERNRAARRGSPRLEKNLNQMQMPGGAPVDPITGIPSHMMYPNQPSPPILTPGQQAQIQMTQQMQHFMQMQMQFMQMMAGQNGNMAQQRPYSQHAASQSMSNLSAMNGMPGMNGMGMMGMGVNGMPMGTSDMMRHSFVGNESTLNMPAEDVHTRSMSMVQPSSASWIHQPQQNAGYAPSIRAQGNYAPSIAPSERSNIGLPGRYRPVSQMVGAGAAPPTPGHLRKSSTMSGALTLNLPDKQPIISVTKSSAASDDDDDEGWAAMKAKRDKKKSSQKLKKGLGSEIGALIH